MICLESASGHILDSLLNLYAVQFIRQKKVLWRRHGKMHLIYQDAGFKVQELKKEVFMEWVNVYTFLKLKNMKFLFLYIEKNSNKASKIRSENFLSIYSPLSHFH